MYLTIQSGVKLLLARNIDPQIMAGDPSYNNTLYMTPIFEVYTWDPDEDNTEIEFMKDTIGPSGDYYKIGFSVSCWYSRNLINNSGVWDFEPTQLYYKLNRSVDTNTPVLFHMNGGNWGSMGVGNVLLQELWENDSNCQYDQFNKVPEMKDATASLMDRLFSLQKDTDFNRYREIHLKQAGKIIANFSQTYPDLFVGCSLDSEIHLDHSDGLYYDYNPLVIADYREWLADRYSLEEYNLKFGRSESSFGNIDAPREAIYGNLLWEEWTVYRHHLVQQNVELQAKWLYESGIPKNKIYSHQILSEPNSNIAYYGRSDPLNTAESEYGVVGVTRYNYINPERFWDIYDISGTDWGIFEWNIWLERDYSSYYLYLHQLKAMYQAGVHVICPNGWFEYNNPLLMIRNNTIFHKALVDFSYLVKDVPRGTAPEAKLNYFDYFYSPFMDFEGVEKIFTSFLSNYLYYLGIIAFIFGISIAIAILFLAARKIAAKIYPFYCGSRNK